MGLDIAPAVVLVEERTDGTLVLRSPQLLGGYERNTGEMLHRRAEERGDGVFLAERERGGGWRRLTWSAARDQAEAIGQSLVDRGLSLERPVAILSGNSIDHALLSLGAQLAGVPVVPVSVAYSLQSRDHERLRYIMGLVTPGLIFAEQGESFGRALQALDLDGVEVVVSGPAPQGLPATPLNVLLQTRPGEAFRAAAQGVGPDTVVKILLTSGSTDVPKGVLNTHRMLTANQQQLVQVWPFVEQTPPVLVDWLPWSHTFGANHNFNLVLKTGGTMYIDAGRPAPGLFEHTVRNLTEVAPTIQFNVPAGYAMLARALEDNEALRRNFFSRLQVIFYAAAAMPPELWRRLDELAVRTLGHEVWMTTSWGATETAPLATAAHYRIDHPANIGLPVPGCELKMVPAGRKLELRVRGPNVMPGYHRAPDKTAAVFDEEGFYRIGDAGKFADPTDPSRGIVFDGRVMEDFKLQTGTWVSVAHVRTEALSATGGLLASGVVAGHDREYVGLLAWLDPAQAAAVAGDRPIEELVVDEKIQGVLRERLGAYNATVGGSSRRVQRVMLLTEPPSLDAGEITDKGYINQAAVLENRADAVEVLYADQPPPNVVILHG